MQAELVTIETKRSKAGDPAIQLVFKTEDAQWVREYIGITKAPDFVWVRWGKCFGISEDAGTTRDALTNSNESYKHIGAQVVITCEEEDYQGRTYLKIKDAKPIGFEQEDAPPVVAKDSEGITDDDIPF